MAAEERIERTASLPGLDEDLQLQIRGWKVQRVCWFFLLLLLILTGMGLFGEGVLSKRRLMAEQVSFEYERFPRYSNETEVLIRMRSPGPRAEVEIPLAYLSCFKTEEVFPAVFERKVKGDDLSYSFDTGGKDSLLIAFRLTPQKRGSVSAEWNVNGTDLRVSHFIYP